MFDQAVIKAAMEDARLRFPEESCGIVTRDEYLSLPNVVEDPKVNFRIQNPAYFEAVLQNRLQAVVHSHPDGQDHPSYEDMEGQVRSGVPWGIVTIRNGVVNEPFWYGDGVPIAELIGRPFRHGVADCYALVCDWFQVTLGIHIPPQPRSNMWWLKQGQPNLFDLFDVAGFRPIPQVEKIGDCVVGRVAGPVDNHCGVYVGRGLMLHHLINRYSRHDPIGPWMKFVNRIFRHRSLV